TASPTITPDYPATQTAIFDGLTQTAMPTPTATLADTTCMVRSRTGEAVNIRQQPGIQHPRVDLLNGNQNFVVIGRNSNRSWLVGYPVENEPSFELGWVATGVVIPVTFETCLEYAHLTIYADTPELTPTNLPSAQIE